jgi:hypothetical protein
MVSSGGRVRFSRSYASNPMHSTADPHQSMHEAPRSLLTHRLQLGQRASGSSDHISISSPQWGQSIYSGLASLNIVAPGQPAPESIVYTFLHLLTYRPGILEMDRSPSQATRTSSPTVLSCAHYSSAAGSVHDFCQVCPEQRLQLGNLVLARMELWITISRSEAQ